MPDPAPPHLTEDRWDTRDQELAETKRLLRRTQELLRSGCPAETVGSLAAGIAHEINTLSQFLGDNLAFLGDAFEDFQKQVDPSRLAYLRKEVPEAVKSSQEGLRRVNEILEAVRHFHHPIPGEKSLVHLHEIVNNCLVISRGEWKYSAKVETDFDPDLPPLACFRDELSLVVLNLMINAARAIQEKAEVGLIQIQTRRRGSNAELVIQDSGTGIPEKLQANIFDPFTPAGSVAHGLPSAYRVVVDRHAGQLVFCSIPGEGTTFTILLPLSGA